MHTPGPWTLNDTDNISSWSVQAKGGKRICAARWYPWTAEAKMQARSNALLIAAAPELLEALEALMEGRPTEEPPKLAGIAHKNWTLFQKARAAIAKAKGE